MSNLGLLCQAFLRTFDYTFIKYTLQKNRSVLLGLVLVVSTIIMNLITTACELFLNQD